jgi:hypothetical protein
MKRGEKRRGDGRRGAKQQVPRVDFPVDEICIGAASSSKCIYIRGKNILPPYQGIRRNIFSKISSELKA